MKFVYALSFLLALTAVNADTYTTENDDFDIDVVAADPQKLKELVDCFLDTAVCSSVAADFKKDLPEVFETACKKCTEKQKIILRKFLEALKTKQPTEYEAFIHKFDAEGKYFTSLKDAIA